MAEKSEIEKELKPVSGIMTKTAKVVSGGMAFVGAVIVAVGAMSKGKKVNVNGRDYSAPKVFGTEGGLLTLAGLLGFHVAQGAARAKSFVETEHAKDQLVDAAQNLAEKTHGR